MRVKASSEVQSDERPTAPLTGAELKSWIPWIQDIPDEAHIDAITRDIGSQRDPWPVLSGLRATWEAEKT